jgi:hypothetical protein
VATTTISTTVGQILKIDYSLDIEATCSVGCFFAYEVRIYRNSLLLDSRIISQAQESAGTFSTPISGTYVDTAEATAPYTYEIRVIETSAVNVTSAFAKAINLNIISFQTME